MTLTMPADTAAFYFYAEPNPFALFTIIVSSGGVSSAAVVDGSGGAYGWGIYDAAGLTSITISSGMSTSPSASLGLPGGRAAPSPTRVPRCYSSDSALPVSRGGSARSRRLRSVAPEGHPRGASACTARPSRRRAACPQRFGAHIDWHGHDRHPAPFFHDRAATPRHPPAAGSDRAISAWTARRQGSIAMVRRPPGFIAPGRSPPSPTLGLRFRAPGRPRPTSRRRGPRLMLALSAMASTGSGGPPTGDRSNPGSRHAQGRRVWAEIPPGKSKVA